MDKKERNEEIQSRREFFKKAAKGMLPILGAALLANIPIFSKANETPTGCYYGCTVSCYGDCFTACSNNACRTNCTYTCSGGCDRTCSGTCSGTCYGTCVGGNMF